MPTIPIPHPIPHSLYTSEFVSYGPRARARPNWANGSKWAQARTNGPGPIRPGHARVQWAQMGPGPGRAPTPPIPHPTPPIYVYIYIYPQIGGIYAWCAVSRLSCWGNSFSEIRLWNCWEIWISEKVRTSLNVRNTCDFVFHSKLFFRVPAR